MTISQNQQPIETGLGARSEPDEILSGIDLNGKNVLVTGGYSGIGLETTRALAKAGAHVHVPARRPETAQAALDGMEGKDLQGRPIRCNESQPRERR